MNAADKRQAVRSSKPFNLLDIAFFGAVVILILVFTLAVYGFTDKAATVTVTTPEKTRVYSLDRNAEIDIDGYLTLVIEDGTAYVKDARCPDKVCEHTGKISRSGQMIACLPSGIVITVSGESDFVEVG